MKIVLDTKEETLQDLKDTMRILQALIESRGGSVASGGVTSSLLDSKPAEPVAGLMSLFNDPSPSSAPGSNLMPTSGTDILASLERKTEDPKVPEVQIIEY